MKMTEKLLLVCTGPSDHFDSPGFLEVDFGLDKDALTKVLEENRWFLSVLTPSGQGPEVPLVLGPICERCAKEVMPEVVAKFYELRSKTT